VDRLVGVITDPALSFENWKATVETRMSRAFTILERRDRDSLPQARQLVNQMVADKLDKLSIDPDPVLYPVNIEVDNQDEFVTTIKVTSLDTPVFLYAFSNALSISPAGA